MLNSSNQVILYQLNGETGQQLSFERINQWTEGAWTLYNPSGTVIATNTTDFTTALPSTGIYTLAISGTDSGTVNYAFQVKDITPPPVTPSKLGTIQSDSLLAGEVDSYSFSSNAGTMIYLDSSSNNSDIRIRLLNPDGSEAFSNYDSRFYQGPMVLQQTGEYTIEFYGVFNTVTGDYSYQIFELSGRSQTGVNNLDLGRQVSGTVNNDKTIYAFAGEAGLPIMFNGIEGNHDLRATLYDPNGHQLFSQNNFRSNNHEVYTLAQNGLYYPDSTPEDLSDNPRMVTEYDGAGRAIAEIDELGNRTEFEYDGAGNIILERDALGNETDYRCGGCSRSTHQIQSGCIG